MTPADITRVHLPEDGGVLDRIAGLRVARSGGRPKLYQPIVLLWAIGRARRGEPRLAGWDETHRALTGLLRAYGTGGERPRPDYPAAALHHAGLWELSGDFRHVPRAHGDGELKRWFAEHRPAGGLTEEAYALMQRSGRARMAALDTLLHTYFTDGGYEALLAEVGLFDDAVAEDGAAGDELAEEVAPAGPDASAGAARTPLGPAARAVASAARYEQWCRMVEHRQAEDQERHITRTVRQPVRYGPARRAVLERCQGLCENPGCAGQPEDLTHGGQPLLEVDHVLGLAEGGDDHPRQMVALCPNCHAVKTRGQSRNELRRTLLEVARLRHAAFLSGRLGG